MEYAWGSNVKIAKENTTVSNTVLNSNQTQLLTKIKVKNGDFNSSNPFWLNKTKEEGNFILLENVVY